MKNHLRECLEKEGLILGTRINQYLADWLPGDSRCEPGLYDYIESIGEYAPYDQ